jgi:non-specific serine/threonine protein kinase/serine/threonine-protein kinase
MTPEQWQTVKSVLAGALEIQPYERSGYIERTCGTDSSLRQTVERLLLQEKPDAEFLNTGALSKVASVVLAEESPSWIGRRVGPYQIIEQLGAGGMGEVYRAFRADDQYRKEVALKIIAGGEGAGVVLTRFRNERQILANLEHPNIARLLDGGTTEEGIPYFVMELIEGKPITEYCDSKKLDIAERLKLFLQVCAAVQYAHQRLIIHRDIKPANILVTSDGSPKLLDFGIAKILARDPIADSPETTLPAFRILTPSYASPEQVKGEPMTTASDVYSLGVVLYELLTGRSPYAAAGTTSNEIARAACDSDPLRPSLALYRSGTVVDANFRPASAQRIARRLRGDLDNIVLMALRKEPSRRYASVEQLSDDLRRHLDSVPVVARKDTLAYRTSKFFSRHKAGVTGTVAVALALIVGLAFALHENRVARIQRARAERRFNDVRKLANSLMFDIHDSIVDLPGAMPARKLLVSRAQEYLDSLSQESAGDLTLQQELASAYDRVGDLLGFSGTANLGDFTGALQNYKKAIAIRESAAAANPDDDQLAENLLNNYFRLSFVLQDAGDFPGALEDLQKALPLAQRLLTGHPDAHHQDWLAGVYWRQGHVLKAEGEYVRALESFRQGAAIREGIAGLDSMPPVRSHLAADYVGVGQMLARTGDPKHGFEKLKKASQILEQLTAAYPTNSTVQEYLAESYGYIAAVVDKQGKTEQALDYDYKANGIFERLLVADPNNALSRDNYGISEIDIGHELLRKKSAAQALPRFRKALSIFEKTENKTHYVIAGLAESYSALGDAYLTMSEKETSSQRRAEHLRDADEWYRKSVRTWDQEPDHGALNPLEGEESRADVAVKLARCEMQLTTLLAQR